MYRVVRRSRTEPQRSLAGVIAPVSSLVRLVQTQVASQVSVTPWGADAVGVAVKASDPMVSRQARS